MEVYPRVLGVISLKGFEAKPIVRTFVDYAPIFGILLFGSLINDPLCSEISESVF